MKKLVIVLILILCFVPVLHAQDNEQDTETEGGWRFGFELPGLGVGIGPIYREVYGLLIPDMETRLSLFFGGILSGGGWFGEGNQEPYTVTTDATGVSFIDTYVRFDFIQLILGDHYEGYYYLEAGAKYESMFRFVSSRPDDLYQGDVINGDETHQKQRLTFLMKFDYSNDSQHEFRRVWGVHFLTETFFEAGSKYDPNFWSYLGLTTELDGWIPIFEKNLFVHLYFERNIITESFTGTAVAFYAIPGVSNGNWDPVRGFSTAFRGLSSNTASIEIKTRPLELESEVFGGLDWLISFFSAGGALFFDIGFIRHPIDYADNLTVDDILKYSMGVYFESKYIVIFDLLPVTLHLGAVLFHNDTSDGSGAFDPRFYFAFG
jgi:hypothetical protein